MLVEGACQCEIFFVVPKFDLGIVGAADDERLGGVDEEGSDEVGMRLEGLHLFSGVVIEDSDLEVVGPADHPMLLGDEFDCSDGVG